MITLKNITRFQVVIHSADGDAIILNPAAIATTDDKFLWQLDDRKVKIIRRSDDGTQHRINPNQITSVPGPSPNPLSNQPKNTAEQLLVNQDYARANV